MAAETIMQADQFHDGAVRQMLDFAIWRLMEAESDARIGPLLRHYVCEVPRTIYRVVDLSECGNEIKIRHVEAPCSPDEILRVNKADHASRLEEYAYDAFTRALDEILVQMNASRLSEIHQVRLIEEVNERVKALLTMSLANSGVVPREYSMIVDLNFDAWLEVLGACKPTVRIAGLPEEFPASARRSWLVSRRGL